MGRPPPQSRPRGRQVKPLARSLDRCERPESPHGGTKTRIGRARTVASALDAPGIGEKPRRLLLQTFAGVEGVRAATDAALAAVVRERVTRSLRLVLEEG